MAKFRIYIFSFDTKSPLFKALRAAAYAGFSSAAAFVLLVVGSDGEVVVDQTFFIGIVTAFANGVAVYAKNKFVD